MELFMNVLSVLFIMTSTILCMASLMDGRDEPLAITCFASLLILAICLPGYMDSHEYKQKKYEDCKEVIAEYNKTIPVDCSVQ